MAITSYQDMLRHSQRWQFDMLRLRDGARLRWAIWPTEGTPLGYVLMIPGRAETIEKYTEEAVDWGQRGFQALCLDLRGQGGSSRPVPHRSFIDSFETYLDDLREFGERVWQPRVGNAPAIIQGHSTGAHLALRLLTDSRPGLRADGLILTAPMIDFSTSKIPNWIPPQLAYLAIEILGRLLPNAYAPGQDDFKPGAFAGNPHTHCEFRHQQWQLWQMEHPRLVSGGATFGWLLASRRSRRVLLAQLPRLTTPTLALITPNDRVVDGASQHLIRNAQIVEFPGQGHELLRETDDVRNRLWELRDQFMAPLLTPKTPHPSL